ncbi:LuxR family transcriptional regulator [Chelativorans salis]|uniref:LuxR family transcriptional regulator n=1 Tax=Chelativorans salis TaxID=2978478 RepID=A0ABT2LUQ1_9HYPH|nr:LuxR family transcriptional regulator [Chelativorans sp. EGI FJ00035]MCT7378247.1 LuxR family transcriptional regulator [Chelativorans sp. EGI FJ00035]
MNASQFFHHVLLLANATGIDALVETYRAAIREFGLRYFILTGLPASGQRFETLILERFWPDDWMSHYLSCGYVRQDPVAVAGASCTKPFTWNEATIRARDLGPAAGRIMTEAADAGLKAGFCVPVPVRNARSGCISLAGESPSTRPDILEPLNVLSLTFASRLQLLIPTRQGRPRLSNRECEVLTWVAVGKTTWDISHILCISESTVNKHIASAMRKLDCVTRTQAVVKALALMEIAA